MIIFLFCFAFSLHVLREESPNKKETMQKTPVLSLNTYCKRRNFRREFNFVAFVK